MANCRSSKEQWMFLPAHLILWIQYFHPKKTDGVASGFEGELGNWNVLLMAHNSWRISVFDLGQNFGNPYFKWTDPVVRSTIKNVGPPKKTLVPQRLNKSREEATSLFCVTKSWFHQSWIHPKIIRAWHHSEINQFQSFHVLFTNIYFLSILLLYIYPLFDSNLISWHTPGTFQPFPPPIPAAHLMILMEPCFLSPDSVQLWSCVTLLATSLPKETYVPSLKLT